MLQIQDADKQPVDAPQSLRAPDLFTLYNRPFSLFRRRLTFGIHYQIFLKTNWANPGHVFRSEQLLTECLRGWALRDQCDADCLPGTTAQLFHQMIWVYFFDHEKTFVAYSRDDAGHSYPVDEQRFPQHFARQRWLFEPQDMSAYPETAGLPRELEANVEVVVWNYRLDLGLNGTRGFVLQANPADGMVTIRLDPPNFPYELVLKWYNLRIV